MMSKRSVVQAVVARDREPAPLVLVVDGHRMLVLVDGADLGAEPDDILKLGVERVRQAIHAADDLLHVDIRLAEALAELLDDGVVELGLDEVQDAVGLDCPFGEALPDEELAQRILVVLAHDRLPGRFAFALQTLAEVSGRLIPELFDRPALLVSSTSWTPDENFSILFEALCMYEARARDVNAQGVEKSRLPTMLVILTGKGPLKAKYMNEVDKLQRGENDGGDGWKWVRCISMWLEAEDYPLLLGSFVFLFSVESVDFDGTKARLIWAYVFMQVRPDSDYSR